MLKERVALMDPQYKYIELFRGTKKPKTIHGQYLKDAMRRNRHKRLLLSEINCKK